MVRSRSYHAVARSRSKPSIRSRNPYAISNAFISVNPFEVGDASESANTKKPKATKWPSALRTVAVKDNITTLDLPTTCASSTLKSHVSPFEATVVEILRSMGAKVQGKTNLDEFGMGSHSINSFFGPVHKDSIPRYSVGGSSGGSAIAVAEKVSLFALGTDTGGSVRLPAAYTGVVGYKPSYGLISRRGVVPYANSLDTVGILAPDAKYLHHVLRYVRQHDDQDPTSVTSTAWERINAQVEPTGSTNVDYFTNLTIGFPVEYNIEELEPSIRQTWRETLSLLRKKGCKIVPVSLPSTKHALSAYYVLAPAEAASNLSKYDGVRYGTREAASDGAEHVLYSETRGEGFGDEVKRRILLGSYTLSATAIDNYFVKAQKVRRLVQRDFDRVFKKENPLLPPQQFDISDMHESIPLQNKLGPSQVDFILCPTAPTLPPTLGDAFNQTGVDSYMNDVFTVPASLAGLPAISIPCTIPERYHKQDLPTVAGIQIIGQYGDDFRMLELSKKLDRMLNPSYATPTLKTENLGEGRPGKTEFKMDAVRPKKITKSLAHPWLNTEIVLEKTDPEGPRISKHFTERVVAENVVIKHIILPRTSEPSQDMDGPRHGKRLARHIQIQRKELLRKYISERGEYHRKSLTAKEASNMLLDGFDEWLESNQGRDTYTTAMVDQQRKSMAMTNREMVKAVGKHDRGSGLSKRETGLSSNGSQGHPDEIMDRKSDVRINNTPVRDSLEDIDDVGSNETESVSWDDAVRSLEQDALSPDPSMWNDTNDSRSSVKRNPFDFAEDEDPKEKRTAKQDLGHTSDWIPEPKKIGDWNNSFETLRKQHSMKAHDNNQNSTLWNDELPKDARLNKNTHPITPPVSDSWSKLMEDVAGPPSKQKQMSKGSKTTSTFSRKSADDEGAKYQDKFPDSQTSTVKGDAGSGNPAKVGGSSWWNRFT